MQYIITQYNVPLTECNPFIISRSDLYAQTDPFELSALSRGVLMYVCESLGLGLSTLQDGAEDELQDITGRIEF